jgi:DNA-binding transcriptional ArsR family regulator
MPSHAPRPRSGAKALDYRKLAALFKQISDRTRLHVLLILADGEHSVEAIHALVGRNTAANLLHHLALLRYGGIIEQRRRQGKVAFYALTDRGRRLVEVARALMD